MKKRILVIDDEQVIRTAFTLALEDTRYLVHAAESGEAGIRILKEQTYDLVFLDLRMPGMDGVATLRRIREVDLKVPVYIVTAFHIEFLDQLKAVSEDGINFELLHKPVGSDQIIEVAQGALGRSESGG